MSILTFSTILNTFLSSSSSILFTSPSSGKPAFVVTMKLIFFWRNNLKGKPIQDDGLPVVYLCSLYSSGEEKRLSESLSLLINIKDITYLSLHRINLKVHMSASHKTKIFKEKRSMYSVWMKTPRTKLEKIFENVFLWSGPQS